MYCHSVSETIYGKLVVFREKTEDSDEMLKPQVEVRRSTLPAYLQEILSRKTTSPGMIRSS